MTNRDSTTDLARIIDAANRAVQILAAATATRLLLLRRPSHVDPTTFEQICLELNFLLRNRHTSETVCTNTHDGDCPTCGARL